MAIKNEDGVVVDKNGSLIKLAARDDLQALIDSYDPNIVLSKIFQ